MAEPKIGDKVTCVSGPHEGRSGVLTQLRQIQQEWKDPEWYAIVAYEQIDADDHKYTDHFSLPVRRLKLTQ